MASNSFGCDDRISLQVFTASAKWAGTRWLIQAGCRPVPGSSRVMQVAIGKDAFGSSIIYIAATRIEAPPAAAFFAAAVGLPRPPGNGGRRHGPRPLGHP